MAHLFRAVAVALLVAVVGCGGGDTKEKGKMGGDKMGGDKGKMGGDKMAGEKGKMGDK